MQTQTQLEEVVYALSKPFLSRYSKAFAESSVVVHELAVRIFDEMDVGAVIKKASQDICLFAKTTFDAFVVAAERGTSLTAKFLPDKRALCRPNWSFIALLSLLRLS